MEEFESNTEHVEEHLHEHAHHAPERWISGVALTAALLAALAATAGLLSGDHANDAMINQIKASDQWGFYQAKSIKAAIIETRIDAHEVAGKPASPTDVALREKYQKEQAEIQREAKAKEAESRDDFKHHKVIAKSVTLFQVGIAISAIAH